jgi:hypothetical protein
LQLTRPEKATLCDVHHTGSGLRRVWSGLRKNWAFEQVEAVMYAYGRHWLEYDLVAFAALVIGLGAVELLALII